MTAQYATTGPWEIVKDDDQWRLRQKGTVKRRPGFTIERPIAEGFLYKLDAQLAAEAPALLDALEKMVEYAHQYSARERSQASAMEINETPISDDVTVARAAIAKARGGK